VYSRLRGWEGRLWVEETKTPIEKNMRGTLECENLGIRLRVIKEKKCKHTDHSGKRRILGAHCSW